MRPSAVQQRYETAQVALAALLTIGREATVVRLACCPCPGCYGFLTLAMDFGAGDFSASGLVIRVIWPGSTVN